MAGAATAPRRRSSPAPCVARKGEIKPVIEVLWAFLGLDATRADAAAAAAAVDGDPNAKHRDAYCATVRSDPRKARDHARLAARYGALVREHHDYDLAGWCA